MISISKNDPILKIEGLKTKIDQIKVSNFLLILLGSYEETLIVQQLHSWIIEEEGIILDGNRWVDKSIKEWLEVLPNSSAYKIDSRIKSLIAKNVLKREHLYKEHHGQYFAPRNRIYYYCLNYEQLSKLDNEFE